MSDVDDESPQSDAVLFHGDTILDGSVEDGLVLAAEPDPEGAWLTIGWHKRQSVGYWTGIEGDQSIDLSPETAEKLLPTLVDFVSKSKNTTTSYWTGAIAGNPKIAERGHVSSELSKEGSILLRTEHLAIYVKREQLDDAIYVLVAARQKLRDAEGEA